MKLSLAALSLALSSVHGIPASSHDAGLLAAREDYNFASGRFSLDERATGMSYAQVQLAVAKEFKTVKDKGSLKLKWDLKSECPKKCTGKQATDPADKSKCRQCPAKTKPNTEHTKCIREDTGCADDEIQNDKKKCEKCPAGQQPEAAGRKCTSSRPEKPKGKCPDGMVLDPEEGGQDDKTDNPKCIADDDKKCPRGQSAATRLSKVSNEAEYEPTCGPDDDTKHKCPDPNTFDNREIPNDSDKIKHTCRSTRKAQNEKRTKYKTRIEKAKGDHDRKDKAAREKRQRARSGWCWIALATVQAWPSDETTSLTEDEIDGMVNSWDDAVPTPLLDGQIPDYVVKFSGYAFASAPVIEGSGPAGITGLANTISNSIGKIIGAGSKGGQAALTGLKTGARGAASGKAIKAAKDSAVVQKILKHSGYKDCLSTAAAEAIGARSELRGREQKNVEFGGTLGKYEIDWSLEFDPNFKVPPTGGDENKRITVTLGKDTDATYFWSFSTYPDRYVRTDRLLYETCQTLEGDYDNAVTDLSVYGGCCSFYNGAKCESDTKLFSMTDRQDGQLDGPHNDAISSFWCTFDGLCTGNP